jgi:hypothetical protein
MFLYLKNGRVNHGTSQGKAKRESRKMQASFLALCGEKIQEGFSFAPLIIFFTGFELHFPYDETLTSSRLL